MLCYQRVRKFYPAFLSDYLPDLSVNISVFYDVCRRFLNVIARAHFSDSELLKFVAFLCTYPASCWHIAMKGVNILYTAYGICFFNE